jgi:DNA phosphorothioation-associated putative methyltransferase
MEYLHFLLRIFVGCANVLAGELPEANIVKINRKEKKVSFLVYPNFDDSAHPALAQSIKVNLQNRFVDIYDYFDSNNPPILHRKELFVDREYPNREKFAKLTIAEEDAGLFQNNISIGNRLQWEENLSKMGYQIKGHTLRKS